MSEKAASDAVTEVARLLKLDFIKDEWPEFVEMMGGNEPPIADDGIGKTP